MPNSEAITKVQSIILIATILVAAIGGGLAYVLLIEETQSSCTIKIGILADIDNYWGKLAWHNAVLAVEELNAEGGVLGRQVEVTSADSVSGIGSDVTEVTIALTKLIVNDQVDFIIGGALSSGSIFACQEIVAEHKKLFFCGPTEDEFTQRVLDDYSKYKYYFNLQLNATTAFQGITKHLLYFREITGFNKVGYLGLDTHFAKGIMEGLNNFLPENGLDLVYKGAFPLDTVDFSSYFASAEAAGVEIMVPLVISGAIPVVKEYSDRQSPMVIFNGILGDIGGIEAWKWTDGKCNYITDRLGALDVGYPLTSKTLQAREAYINRWSEPPSGLMIYNFVRFVMVDAIERAGTINSDDVIEALEEINIETASVRNFGFTKSHARMVDADFSPEYIPYILFQWQNGELAPIHPKEIMEEAGASYTFPDWSGPWDNIS